MSNAFQTICPNQIVTVLIGFDCNLFVIFICFIRVISTYFINRLMLWLGLGTKALSQSLKFTKSKHDLFLFCFFLFCFWLKLIFNGSAWGIKIACIKIAILKTPKGLTQHETLLLVSPGSLHMHTALRTLFVYIEFTKNNVFEQLTLAVASFL